MGPFYLILALLIQNSLAEAITDNEDNEVESREILKVTPEGDDVILKEYQTSPKGWMDLFIGSGSHIFPTSSAALMAQATFSDKSPEEQIEEIKKMADEITTAIQCEMANLLTYAISATDKEDKISENKLRKRRSLESPMDSTKLVMRLLKHIKSNNEYQNIAIEKMMTAQEIADKYGIPFSPDTDTLSDLAVAANEQAREMTEILKDACDLENATQAAANNILVNTSENVEEITLNMTSQQNTSRDVSTNKIPAHVLYVEAETNDQDFARYNYYQNYPFETQIMSTPVYHDHGLVSPRPTFYDYISTMPSQEYYPYCSFDDWPMTYIQPIEEPIVEPIEVLLDPEIVGEEYEETVSSKVCVDHDVPGMSTVNHVTTYTVSEKSHYRTPHVQNLPQQMQYYFLLM